MESRKTWDILRDHTHPNLADRRSRGVNPKEGSEDECRFKTKAEKILPKGVSSKEQGGPAM